MNTKDYPAIKCQQCEAKGRKGVMYPKKVSFGCNTIIAYDCAMGCNIRVWADCVTEDMKLCNQSIFQ